MVRVLGNAVLTMVCTAVIGAVVLTNTAGWYPTASPAGPTSFQITLDGPSRIGAENRHLARIGARVRIVPLESGCRLGRRARRAGGAARRPSGRSPWVRTVLAAQAPAGDTTIVLVSAHGLAGASFQVHGRGPTCVPVIGAVRDW